MMIFYSCYEDLSAQSGGIRHIMEVCDNLIKNGNSVVLFAPSFGRYPFETKTRIIYIPVILKLPVFKAIIYHILLYPWLFVFALKRRPDLFYSRQMGTDLAVKLVSWIMRRPFILEIQAVNKQENIMLKTSRWKRFMVDLFNKYNARHCSKVTTPSEATKIDIMKAYKIPNDKVMVATCGANVDLFRPMDIREARIKVGLNEKGIILGSVSSLYPWHGEEDMIKSMPAVLNLVPSAKLVIVGYGVMSDKLIKLAEKMNLNNSIIFTGSIPYENIPYYVNSFNICLAFSHIMENLRFNPIKMYEYLACNKPVIAEDNEWFSQFTGEMAVLCVDPKKPEKIAELVGAILNGKLKYSESRSKVIEKYSWASSTILVEKVMKELVAGGQK